MAAFQATLGRVVVNAHHEMHQLEPLSIEVLKLANGKQRRSEILEQLTRQAESGAITFDDAETTQMTREELRTWLDRQLERTLIALARSAVLVG